LPYYSVAKVHVNIYFTNNITIYRYLSLLKGINSKALKLDTKCKLIQTVIHANMQDKRERRERKRKQREQIHEHKLWLLN